MKFNDAFYRGFHEEIEELQKEAVIPAIIGGLATAARAIPAALRVGKAVAAAGKVAKPVIAGAKAVGRVAATGGRYAKSAGSGLMTRMKAVAKKPTVVGAGGGGTPSPRTMVVQQQQPRQTLGQKLTDAAISYGPMYAMNRPQKYKSPYA